MMICREHLNDANLAHDDYTGRTNVQPGVLWRQRTAPAQTRPYAQRHLPAGRMRRQQRRHSRVEGGGILWPHAVAREAVAGMDGFDICADRLAERLRRYVANPRQGKKAAPLQFVHDIVRVKLTVCRIARDERLQRLDDLDASCLA
jgi:hypothetical protein